MSRPSSLHAKHKKLLKNRIELAPDNPGCYLWKGENEKILYIGKAIKLKSRLKNYLVKNHENLKTSFLMTKVIDVEWIQTDTEVEALLLEANLVGKHKPRYNVRLKDDKSFPYICISYSEMFPRVFLTRDTKNKKAKYFGPFTDVRAARSTLNLIHKIFPVRKTKQKLPLNKKKKPCMNFHIKRCLGPCQENVSESEYQLILDKIELFLEGKRDSLEETILEKMKKLSLENKFEHAAIYRDMLYEIRKTTESQFVHNISGSDEDIVALAMNKNEGQIVLLEFRSGRMIARKSFPLIGLERELESSAIDESYVSFIRDFYLKNNSAPSKIILEDALPANEKKLLEKTLLEITQKTTRIVKGRSKHHTSVLRLAKKNAELLLGERIISNKIRNREAAVLDLQKMLQLKDLPDVIECYDISHSQGKQTVASGVVFLDGAPHRSEYRHYNIKSVKGINDPASIREAVARRIQRLLNEEKSLPDLIVIDGGLTQLSAACEAALALGQDKLPIISIAKKFEEIYIPGVSLPNRFDKSRLGMRLLMQLRDEAHRFAVGFHRKKRNKATLKSAIEAIPDIGNVRRKALLVHFLDKNLNEASVEQLQQVSGIGKKLALQIHNYFLNQTKDSGEKP